MSREHELENALRLSPPSKDDPSDVLDRLKVLVWQATDDTVLWQQIVIAAIDYAHARTMAALDRVAKTIAPAEVRK